MSYESDPNQSWGYPASGGEPPGYPAAGGQPAGYQPYPNQPYANQPGAAWQGPPPSTVMNAIKLMYAGAVLSALGMIVGLTTTSSLRTAVRNANPSLSKSSVDTAVTIGVASLVVGGLIGIGLWIWMAYANKRGHNWARIVSSVFLGLDTVGIVVGLAQHTTALSLIVSILVWAVGAAAVFLLWRRESTAFFKPDQLRA